MELHTDDSLNGRGMSDEQAPAHVLAWTAISS